MATTALDASALTLNGGPVTAIDCDVHETLTSMDALKPYLPSRWRDALRDTGWRSGAPGGSYVQHNASGVPMATAIPADGTPAGSNLDLVRTQLLDLQEGMIAVLTGSSYFAEKWTQPEFNSALACAYNDWLIDQWIGKEPRLLASVCLPPDPAKAVKEIERMAREPRMLQVQFPVCQIDYARPEYRRLFEVAAANGMVCAFHVGGDTKCGLPDPRYYSTWRTVFPNNYQAQLATLVAGGVLTSVPDLNVLLTEGGFSWMPHFRWRVDQSWQLERLETPWLTRPPSEIIAEKVWFSTQPLDEPADKNDLLRLIEIAKLGSRIVYSSDYPHWDFDDPLRVLSGWPQPLKQALMLDNPIDLYGERLRKALASA